MRVRMATLSEAVVTSDESRSRSAYGLTRMLELMLSGCPFLNEADNDHFGSPTRSGSIESSKQGLRSEGVSDG